MEKLCYGTSYTAFSRCTKESDWCLAEEVPFERLAYINRHPKKTTRFKGEQQLIELSKATYLKHKCTKQEYLNLLRDIDEFCNDGINDAICRKK